jgi:tetratricopeptide (TPR) repeat protein
MKYASRIAMIVLSIAPLFLNGCKTYDNFTTFFNTYYNAQRLIKESESEFEYQDEKKRVQPQVIIPQPNFWKTPDRKVGAPPFMNDFIIDGRKLQTVRTKLDSVNIKGSKILAKHPKSDYVEKTLFLMANSYFYLNDWMNCQVKCSELLDKFPEGDLAPDAYLMISKTYLIRKKTVVGKTLLSRTVDMAWLKKRYDILSEAFRLEAALALYEQDMDGALRPYKQAIAQSDDNEQNAKWQVEMASLLYRMGKFDKAERAFAMVNKYSPDYQGEFESDLYGAICKLRLKKDKEANAILDKLYDDGKYSEWRDYVVSARMIGCMVNNDDSLFKKLSTYADTAFPTSSMLYAVYFEKGMRAFDAKDYSTAKDYLAMVKTPRSDFYTTTSYLYKLTVTWDALRNNATYFEKESRANKFPERDSTKMSNSGTCYDFGRIHEKFGNEDSALVYYTAAYNISPKDSASTAQYIYNYSRLLRKSDPIKADSLFELLAEKYPKTEYGQEAVTKLGYTQYYAIDTVADIFSSGNQLRKNGLYDLALQKFNTVQEQYPANKLAPKSLYSMGWIYENKVVIPDSALKYYSLLLQRYPKSEYAADINLSVAFLSASRSGAPLPDSLKKKQVFLTPKRDFKKEIEKDANAMIKPSSSFDRQQSVKKSNSLDPSSYLDELKKTFDPTTIISKPKDQLSDPNNLVPGLKINNPFDDLKKKDSTGVKFTPVKPIEEKKK